MGREFEGKDVKEALEKASEALGVRSTDLHYELLEEGRRGVFGLGARRVRIRVEPVMEDAADRGSSDASPRPPASRSVNGPDETIRRMIRLMGLELNVRTSPIEGGLRVELAGPDRRVLMSQDGEVLSALQFLLNRMARRAWPGAGRILVDCEGYRDRHEAEVVELTREAARQVARTGSPTRLEPMNPNDRRLVHVTVREFPGLTTQSEGDGFLKIVTVARLEERARS